MAEQEEGTAHVQVAGAKERDMGKGTARLDRQVLQELGLREGEVIEISGRSAVIALPPYPEDEGLKIIRLDGLERANAGVSIGDRVEVRRAEVRPAVRIGFTEDGEARTPARRQRAARHQPPMPPTVGAPPRPGAASARSSPSRRRRR